MPCRYPSMHRLRLDWGQVPPNVHFSKLNPTIDLDDFAAEIPIATTALTGTMLSSGQVSWLFSMGYAWIWWNSISEFSSLFSVPCGLKVVFRILSRNQCPCVRPLLLWLWRHQCTCDLQKQRNCGWDQGGSGKLRLPKSTKNPRKSKPNSKQIYENLITWSTWCVWYVWWELLVRWPAKSEQPSFSQGKAHSVLAWGKSSMPLRTGLNQPAPRVFLRSAWHGWETSGALYKCHNTVDGRNPAPPGMYETLYIMGLVVQDFVNQQYFQKMVLGFGCVLSCEATGVDASLTTAAGILP